MPLDGQRLWSLDRVLTADDMLGMLAREFGPLSPVPDADPRAPATEYQFADGYRVGFIASVSRPFCLNCNRLRLTSDGKLRYCLFAREETDIAHLLDDEPALQAAIRATVWKKWAGHEINRASFRRARASHVFNRRLTAARATRRLAVIEDRRLAQRSR